MKKRVSRKFGMIWGALLFVNSVVALAYLYVSTPSMLMAPWLFSGSGFCSFLGI